MTRQSEHGSILFIILIGVALFAALSYAVVGSMRSGAGNASSSMTEEKMNLALTELRSAVVDARTAIQAMTISGYALDQVDAYAEGPTGVQYYPWSNPLCTKDDCKLYSPSGGGLKFFLFSKIYPQFSGVPNIVDGFQYPQGLYWTWWAYKGTLQADIIYRVKITKAFCNFINKKNGITADIDSFPSSGAATEYQLGGHFTSLAASHYYSFTGDGGDEPYLLGKSDGCYLATGTPNEYRYVALVYAR